MAEKKISTIILKVDLECTRCYKKISKTICKIQKKENIQTIVFNEKANTVTISGPFDPKKVIKKLCCNACKVIKDIQVKDDKEKEKPKDAKPAAEPTKDKPKDAKPAAEAAKDKPKDDKPKDDKPKDKPKDAKPADEPKKDKPKDAKPTTEPAKDKPKDAEPQKDKPKALESYPPASEPGFFMVHEPRFDYQPVWGGPVCACGGPRYDGYYYGDNRGCWCGRGSGWAPGGPMGPSGPPPVVYGQPVYGGGYKTQNYFCEENPESCNVM